MQHSTVKGDALCHCWARKALEENSDLFLQKQRSSTLVFAVGGTRRMGFLVLASESLAGATSWAQNPAVPPRLVLSSSAGLLEEVSFLGPGASVALMILEVVWFPNDPVLSVFPSALDLPWFRPHLRHLAALVAGAIDVIAPHVLHEGLQATMETAKSLEKRDSKADTSS